MTLVAHKYMPSEISEAELEATFAARGHTVDYLVKMLRDQIHSGTLSSFVVTGPRGAGKSTVLRMVALRIKQDAALSAAWWPVHFPEEQFNITSLRDLLAATLRLLSSQNVSSAGLWLDKVEAEANDEQSQQLAVTGLREVARARKQRLVLFIENLNLLFEEGLTDQEKGAFRRLLMTDPFMMVLGSAVHVFESLRRYDEAFFNYFGEVRLDRLSAEQVFELLTRRAKYDGNERFLREFPQNQPKIRAIIHLSGGNPRLILMLYEMLSQKQVTTVVQHLRRLVDELTPLLKDEMESLPPQQRKIVHALMEKGGTAQPVDLVTPTRLKLNTITEQLRRLKQAQVLEVLGGGKGRPAFYTVPDQLFSIWYQMRYLRQNRRRIELFVEVLRIWFEAEERFDTIRSCQSGLLPESPAVLRDAATTAEYFAATLVGTPYEEPARNMALQGWLRAGDLHEAALAHAEFSRIEIGNDRLLDAQAYASFGTWSLKHKDLATAVASLEKAVKSNPSPENILVYGVALGNTGLHTKALDQFDAVVATSAGNIAVLAKALFNRGVAKQKARDLAGASADYTNVVELAGAPKEPLARALTNRGVVKGMAGDLAGALADYTAVVELAGAPKEPVSEALFNRGVIKVMAGDLPSALADYTSVVDLAGAPNEWMAKALVNRGLIKVMAGDLPGALVDYTSVVDLAGAPNEWVAPALVNRGVAKWEAGDLQGALADYTAVVEMAGAPKEQVVKALVNRGVAKGNAGDHSGAIADFTFVIDMEEVSATALANALTNRGVAAIRLNNNAAAQVDWERVLRNEKADANAWIAASGGLFQLHWLAGRRENAEHALELLKQRLGTRNDNDRAEGIVQLLSKLACPALREAWPRAWRLLVAGQPPTVVEALQYLEPVAKVIEGAGVNILNALSPEQREFVQRIVTRFNPASRR